MTTPKKPPHKVGTDARYPYENARRAGITQPDLVEVIGRDDPRHWSHPKPGPDNRAAKRARFAASPDRPRTSPRKWQPAPWLPESITRLQRRSSPRVED